MTQKQGETKSKSIISSTFCTQTPKKNKERPQYGRQFYYGEKPPMAWGVPQQIDKPHKPNLSYMQEKLDI